MKKITLILAAAILLHGCGGNKERTYTDAEIAKYQQLAKKPVPEPTGGMVLSVKDQTISSELIISKLVSLSGQVNAPSYQQYKQQVYPYVRQFVTEKISDILIYEKAAGKVPEEVLEEDGMLDKAVDKEVRRMLAESDYDYSKIQSQLAESGYHWKTFKEEKRRKMLIQNYFTAEFEKSDSVSFKEIEEFYEENKDDKFKIEPEYKFTLIHIPESAENADKKASLANLALEGGMSFSDAVEKFSGGPKASQGGKWETSDPSSFAEPYDAIAEELKKLEEGQISDVIENNGNFFIVKVDKKQQAGFKKLSQVQDDIEEFIRMKRRSEKMNNILKELFEQAKISEANGFIEFCIRQAYSRSSEG
ncbi:peptidylprolyl isomerase [Sedimentisphaera cyanobacteriorum]|uniref:peptidylprolyl isomerase n=1 Tax=Sedimentisphaera cyanobacteriorum TaxID=1940790 RepID=A0A1Q2HT18_9BACT|nr:peptidyl-prolyl cis-trans isomerase [Sedimentisphaera cyanobacteriorum]AQQ10465.1 peptidylprolyl isomerase [Sedimentisphaera cyanobacteriorum]